MPAPNNKPDAAIYTGEVYHGRHTPFPHHFRYSVFALWLNIDQLDETTSRLKYFSINKWNILGLFFKDHGPRDGTHMRPWIEKAAAQKDIDLTNAKVYMLCFPRLWGYVFNPISVYYCYDQTDQLIAILYQVKNTFGQQHGYFMPVTDYKNNNVAQSCDKVFHVSPFIQMDCTYNFRLTDPAERFDLAIHQFIKDGDKILTATWNGKRKEMNDFNILKTVLRFPLMTVKVIVGIHWEALRLWIKGAKYIPVPPLPKKDIT